MNLLKKPSFYQELQQNKTGWKKSFLDGFSQDENGESLPWMTYNAINFFKNHLNKDQKIFEFGCGSSTLFFAKRVKKVVCLETNPIWHSIIQQKLSEQNLDNVEITLMKDGIDNDEYENFAKNYREKFNFIIVDSLKRFNCSKNSISALEPNGSLVLDDSERKHYQKIFNFMKESGFKQQDFEGIAPGQLRQKNTTIFGARHQSD